MKAKSVSLITGTVLALSLLSPVKMPGRLSQVMTPSIAAAAPEDHIELLSYSLGLGLAPDQTLRITVLDPNGRQPRHSSEPARARVKLFLADGTLILESPEVLIPEGGFTFVDFRRVDLPVPGDSLTGRVQVLAQVILFVRDVHRVQSSPVSGEIISTPTGQTQAYVGFVGGVSVAAGDLD